MEKRPKLNNKISVKDFKDFYWKKEELLEFCRLETLEKRGSKIELSDRIEKYLRTGEKFKYFSQLPKAVSRFDWNTEKLSLETPITDNYKNTENVRTFFKEQIGDHFTFNTAFMNWMKTAHGFTLGDAVKKWLEITSESQKGNLPKQIAPQFEYNTYIRDFLKDNPGKSLENAISCWNMKKRMRGDNKYKKSDLVLIEK